MRWRYLCLIFALFFIVSVHEMRCRACHKGPFKNISSHVTRCSKATKLIEGGYARRIAEGKLRRAAARAAGESLQRQARERQEAIERAEAERQACIQVSLCCTIRLPELHQFL